MNNLTLNGTCVACGDDGELFLNSHLHARLLAGYVPGKEVQPGDLKYIAKSEKELEQWKKILEITEHPVLISEYQYGCNVEFFSSITKDVVELFKSITGTGFLEKYKAFMAPGGGLQRSLENYEKVSIDADESNPNYDLYESALQTIRCLDYFPATYCYDTKSPESQTRALYNNYLDGDCVCTNDQPDGTPIISPLFHYRAVQDGFNDHGDPRMQCRASNGSTCDSHAGPVPCFSADYPEPQFSCSPIKEPAKYYRGGNERFIFIYSNLSVADRINQFINYKWVCICNS